MIPLLYERIEDCSACGACMSVCPKGAIRMQEDRCGFKYPVIDAKSCIECEACVRACRFSIDYAVESIGPWFAGAGKGDISKSSSGGAFATFAEEVIKGGGVSFGAACVRQENKLYVSHQSAQTSEEIDELKDSKYVQSSAWTCYSDVKDELKKGRKVLFSGTPCQVAGLKGYLGRDWDNLLTVDLVCHGVPSQRMFSDWVQSLEHRLKKLVTRVRFRSKRDGWRNSTRYIVLDLADGSEAVLKRSNDAYYSLFEKAQSLRDCCYACPFAGRRRVGDITIGDFWGIWKTCPNIMENTDLDVKKGISCILANTERGVAFLSDVIPNMTLEIVDFSDIAENNPRLIYPSIKTEDRNIYLNAYAEKGWNWVEKLWHRRERGLKYQMNRVIGYFRIRKPYSVLRKALESLMYAFEKMK